MTNGLCRSDSTSTAPPTSCGRTTPPASTACSSTTAAGHPNNTSNGSATRSARNCCEIHKPTPCAQAEGIVGHGLSGRHGCCWSGGWWPGGGPRNSTPWPAPAAWARGDIGHGGRREGAHRGGIAGGAIEPLMSGGGVEGQEVSPLRLDPKRVRRPAWGRRRPTPDPRRIQAGRDRRPRT